MTFEEEFRHVADVGGLLEMNLKPFADAKKRILWRATAACADDQRMQIGIDADPIVAIRKAFKLVPNELTPEPAPASAGVFD